MVKKRVRQKKGFIEKNFSVIILIILLLLGGYYFVSNGLIELPQSITNIYNYDDAQEQLDASNEYVGYWLNINVSPNDICVGDTITGAVTSNIYNGLCTMFVNTGTGMHILEGFRLNATGTYSTTQRIDAAGTALFRAICCDVEGNCKISNDETLVSSICADPDPNPEENGVSCDDGVFIGFGDVGAYCDTLLPCLTKTNCDNYFDPTVSLHRCGCTDTFFCQLDFSYPYGSVCECPPNSSQVVGDDVGEYMCVSD